MTAKKTTRFDSMRRSGSAGGSAGGSAIVGLGNVGTALACAVTMAGLPVAELVVRRRPTAAQKGLAKSLGATLTEWKDWKQTKAEVVWICVADASIGAVGEELARRWSGRGNAERPKLVLHASGALSSRELEPLKKLGVMVGSAHPFRSFPQPVKRCGAPAKSAGKKKAGSGRAKNSGALVGTWFGLEGEAAAVRAAAKMVRALGGRTFVIAAKDKGLYHSFASLAAGMLISLLTAAGEAGRRAGIPAATTRELLGKLSGGTHANWVRNGPAKSFSGPLSRGDTETIELHLASLRAVPEVEAVYRALAGYAVGHLPVKRRAEMEAALRGGERGVKARASQNSAPGAA